MHAGGQEFDPPRLHHLLPVLPIGTLKTVWALLQDLALSETNWESLVRRLADGRQHTLRELSLAKEAAEALLRYGEDMGIAIRLDGDRLLIEGGIDLLDEEALKCLPHVCRFRLLWTVDSTNRLLLESTDQLQARQAAVCVAERQTAGRGRRGRSWFSPFGCNLYLSLGWLFADSRAVDGLSLAMGVEVAECLNDLLPDKPVRLRWPNDLLVKGAKTGGILIEAKQVEGGLLGVCGLGLNLRMANSQNPIDQDWSDLASAGLGISRTELTRRLLLRLLPFLDEYVGIAAYRGRFQVLDYFYGKPVRVVFPGKDEPQVAGVGAGIDEEGAFLVESGGKHIRYRHGEVSLRPLLS